VQEAAPDPTIVQNRNLFGFDVIFGLGSYVHYDVATMEVVSESGTSFGGAFSYSRLLNKKFGIGVGGLFVSNKSEVESGVVSGLEVENESKVGVVATVNLLFSSNFNKSSNASIIEIGGGSTFYIGGGIMRGLGTKGALVIKTGYLAKKIAADDVLAYGIDVPATVNNYFVQVGYKFRLK